MPEYLNQQFGFDEVRWRTTRKTSYDSRHSFQGTPRKLLLQRGTVLIRLIGLPTGQYFDGLWWMPKQAFDELKNDANTAAHGGGRLLRNYIAQYLALPSGSYQLSVVEIELTAPVYAWVGQTSPLFGRPGGIQQVYLPNLADGDPRFSRFAKLNHTYWLKF